MRRNSTIGCTSLIFDPSRVNNSLVSILTVIVLTILNNELEWKIMNNIQKDMAEMISRVRCANY